MSEQHILSLHYIKTSIKHRVPSLPLHIGTIFPAHLPHLRHLLDFDHFPEKHWVPYEGHEL